MNHGLRLCICLLTMLSLPILAWTQRLPDPLSKKEQRHKAKGDAMVAALSHRLIGPHDSTEAQVTAIYDWVTHHIRFDKRSFLKRRLVPQDPLTTLRRKKALSLGYATLTEALCDRIGIPAFTVLGHTQTAMHREGERYSRGENAWNAIQVRGKWQLFDATWGAGPVTKRKQAFRTWIFRRYWIPYRPRYRFAHRPNKEWLNVPPDSLIKTHLPIDPKWQLLDSIKTLAAFESVRDTFIPRLPIDFEAKIAEVSPKTKPLAAIVDGNNAKAINARDDFDIARARIWQGQEGLYKTPELGGDTILWEQSIAEMQAGKRCLVENVRRLGLEQRIRMKELRKLEITAFTAISLARGEIKFVNADMKMLEKLEGRVNALVGGEMTTMGNIRSRISTIGPPPKEPPKPMKPDLKQRLDAKIATSYGRGQAFSDTIKRQCKALHVAMAKIYGVADSIERSRQFLADRIYDNMLVLVANTEKHYLWASDTLKQVATLTRPHRRSRIQQSGRFWAQCKAASARGNQAMRQFQAVHDVVRTMYLKGLETDSVNFKLLYVNQSFKFWSDNRVIQLNIPGMQYDLEKQHVTTCWQILQPTIKLLTNQIRFLQRYLHRERKAQNCKFQAEMRLATHVQQRADVGIATMRQWISEARAAAKGR